MRRLRRSQRFRADLDDIWFYVAQDNLVAAERLIERVDDVTRRLLDFPRIGPAKPHIATEMRTLPVGRYMILYRVTPETIDLVRIVHQARDISRIELD